MNGRARTNNPILFTPVIALALLQPAAGLAFWQSPETDPADAKAMTELAHRYQNGAGVPRDINKALMYYRKAAEANEPAAMIALGDVYREGVCVNRDIGYALAMYRNAADLGSAEAMTRYGDLLPGDQAGEWFRRAAAKGYAPAMTRLGDLFDEVDWYRRAVAAGDPPAFAKLAARETSDAALKLLRQGAALKEPVAMRMLAHRSGADEAEALFRAAAEAGDVEAMEYHARNSENAGRLGDALMWYSKAAEAGRPRAKFWMQQRAGEVQETIRIAAAKAGDPEALFQQGEIQKAADLGHPEALARLGRFEEAAAKGHPLGLFKVGRIEDAAKAGHPESMRRFGESLPDRADGMRWIKRAAEEGDVPAMRQLGIAYKSGAGIAADAALSRKWLEMAAAKGDSEAQFRLGDAESVQKAAAAGHTEAMVRTGKIEPEKAAAAGSPEAKFQLAKQSKKARDAYRLYLEAANAGYAPAMIAVGDCHREAKGTWRSDIDAVNWYRKAANAGSTEALEILKRLGKTL